MQIPHDPSRGTGRMFPRYPEPEQSLLPPAVTEGEQNRIAAPPPGIAAHGGRASVQQTSREAVALSSRHC